jgi:cobalamin biosynthesis Mg chelatase CobN
MLAKTILTFAGLVASVSAILVTSPTKDQKLDFSKSIEVKWTSVSTDPKTFQLVLVDQSTMNPITVEAEVKTSDNKYTLTNFVATPGAKYKFNFLSNDPMNTGILAQSETFEISKSGSTESSTTEASTTTSTTEASSTTTDSASESTTTDDSSSTMSTSTTVGTASRTTGGSSPAANTANASSAPNKTNAAVALDRTFGVAAGGVLAGLLMLF